MSEETRGFWKPNMDNSIVSEIQSNPFSQAIWDKAVSLAREEEAGRRISYGFGAKNFYSSVPLEELVSIGERIKNTPNKDDQYDILFTRSFNGKRWYDIILGHVNDKVFSSVTECLYEMDQTGDTWERGLDVGTGTGNSLRALSPFFREVIGIDILPNALQETKSGKDSERLPDNAKLVAGTATKLPFKDETFDVATHNGLTHYLTEKELDKYAGEISRVLVPGGLYFDTFALPSVSDPLPRVEEEYLGNAKGLLTCIIDYMLTSKGGNSLSYKEYKNLFEKNGLSQIDWVHIDGVEVVLFQKPYPNRPLRIY